MIGFDAVTGAGVQARLGFDLAATPGVLLLRQRVRLAERLAALGAPEWQRPTRCPLWDVADVVTHLGDATDWGLEALAAAGPDAAVPRFLQGFDPNSTPHEHVVTRRGQAPAVLLARLRAGTDTLAARLQAADPSGAPSVPWVGGNAYSPRLAGLHLLWDSWLHELDLDAALTAAGVAPAGPPDPTELDAVAAYGVFFAGIAFRRALGPTDRVALHVELGDLGYDLQVGEVVRLNRAPGGSAPEALVVRGPAVATVEALAGRGDLREVAVGDPRAIALLSGLAARMRGPVANPPPGRPTADLRS